MARQLKWATRLPELPKRVGGFPMETTRDLVACPLHPSPRCTAGAWDTLGSSAVNEATEHGNAAGVAPSRTSPHRDRGLGRWKGAQEGGCSLHALGAGPLQGCTTWPNPGETRGGWRGVRPDHEPGLLPARRGMQHFPPRSIKSELGAGAGSFQVNRRIRLGHGPRIPISREISSSHSPCFIQIGTKS